MDKGRSLQSLLRDHNVLAEDFFQGSGITSQIRNNLSRFVKYCRTHRTFIERMIQLALNIPYAQLDSPNIRTASHAINEILSNEEPALFELFFQRKQIPSQESSEIPEQLECGIQSEAERLFKFDGDEDTLPPEQDRPEEITGQEVVGLSLQILRQPERNQTCLGHLHKVYSFLIRHDPLPVLGYFQSHLDQRNLLLRNLRYSSISSLVGQLLTSEDKSREYKFETLKRGLLEGAVEQVFSNIEDECFFDGVMVLLQEVLNTTKQSYYEYFQDFKRIANHLVSEATLGRFYNQILLLKQSSFRSASRFLESLFARINSEKEDNNYYHKQETQPTMNFEISVFINNLPTLLSLVEKSSSFSTMTRIHYLSFLDALFASTQAQATSISLIDPSFTGLLQTFSAQSKGGVCKNKLYNLAHAILSRASSDQVKQFLDQRNDIYQKYFANIKVANYSNTKSYNRNQGSAFDIGLISQLARKNDKVLENASKIIGKDFKRICKKYETKIASFQNTGSFSLQEESNFYQFNSQTTKSNSTQGLTGFSLNLVGKNNISIPVLHLPERQQINHTGHETQARHNSENLIQGIRQIVQEEEVVVLTHTLDQQLGFRQEVHQKNVTNETDKVQVQIQKKQEKAAQPIKHQKQTSQTKQITSSPVKVQQTQSTKLVLQRKCIGDFEKARFFSRHLAIFT